MEYINTNRDTEFDAAASQMQTNVVDAISNWCEALYGSYSLQEAVARLVTGLGAEAGMLVRTNLNENRSVRVAIHDSKAAKCYVPLTKDFADSLFGATLLKAKPATLWLGTMHANPEALDFNPKLGLWQDARRTKEFAVLILASGTTTRDHIELHFHDILTPQIQMALATVLPAMARTWASRQVGLITRTVINHRIAFNSAAMPVAPKPLLGISNPAKLSRAEFRVCLLLSRGLSISGVCTELALAEATVRSHLRSVYSKTDSANLAELIFHLIGSQSADKVHSRMSA